MMILNSLRTIGHAPSVIVMLLMTNTMRNEDGDTDDDLDNGDDDDDVEYWFGMLNTRDELAGGEIN